MHEKNIILQNDTVVTFCTSEYFIDLIIIFKSAIFKRIFLTEFSSEFVNVWQIDSYQKNFLLFHKQLVQLSKKVHATYQVKDEREVIIDDRWLVTGFKWSNDHSYLTLFQYQWF